MKKLLAITLTLAMILSLMSFTACSDTQTRPPQNATDIDNPVSPTTISTTTTTARPTTKATTTTTRASSVLNGKWTTRTFTTTDTDGYTYQVTYKISPWILLSNTDIINEAWREVGKDNQLPGFNDWGLTNSGSSYRRDVKHGVNQTRSFWYSMTDMYYCMGTVSIKNITNGFSITSDKPRSIDAALNWTIEVDNPSNYFNKATCIGRTFYSSKTEDHASCVVVRPEMKSDYWGPVSFVLMAPENFSPNYPEGEFNNLVKTGRLGFHQGNCNLDGFISNGCYLQVVEDFRTGVIGKDGKYEDLS